MAAGAKRCVWGWLLATIAVIGGCTSETLEYNGTVTLADYPNPKTLESELAKDVLLEAIGFWKEDKDTQSVSAAHMMEITAFLYLGLHTNWVHDVDARSMNIRPTGPFIGDVGYNTHQRARIYYSNGIVDWLLNDRQGEIPDGSMLVKQMYPTDPNNTSYGGDKVTGWAVMIRDSKSSADGWFWFLFFFPGTPSYGSPVLLSQYGMSFCLSCHAGADNDMHTFSTINNINGKNPSQYTSIHNPPSINAQNAAQLISNGHLTMPNTFDLHLEDVESLLAKVDDHRDTHPKDLADKVGKHLGDMPKELIKMMGGGSMAELMMKPVTPPLTAPNPAIVKAFGKSPVNKKELVVLPWDLTTGHVGVDGVDPEQFVTSDNCRGCHDASLLLGGLQPSMMWYEDTGDPDVPHNKYNLAVFGEWGTSMMGLAGRDPIFHAQLEAEQALRPEIKDWTADLCLSCHQVAGQRQFHLDGNSGHFTAKYTYDKPNGKTQSPAAEYGALGRDGVTCTVCHQITPEGLGEPETFTGKFNINAEPGTMWGPFADADIKPYYMQQSMAMQPRFGKQITDSGLCGSCHTINLPVLPRDASAPPGPDAKIVHEQTTYLEWLNSDFTDSPDTTCQGCHMPNMFKGNGPLKSRIANVEDENFPYIDNRADGSLITPEEKEYRRHTLVGLSLVANRMFQQFPEVLGITTLDPGTPLTYGPSAKGAVHRLTLTQQEMEQIATETVALDASVTSRTATGWDVTVDIQNLAGHKFPSGVGFRRAFIQVIAENADGQTVWASGATDGAGVILGSNGEALPGEFSLNWQDLQPNYSVIDAQDQVLIFESRHINDEGNLTTSFLGLAKEVKDNRLLPKGWQPDGPYADETQLRKLGGELFNPAQPGSRNVRYQINANDIAQVRVRLLYQSTPPYYLRDRFQTSGPETDRLHYLASYVNLDKTIAEDWAVEVASTTVK